MHNAPPLRRQEIGSNGTNHNQLLLPLQSQIAHIQNEGSHSHAPVSTLMAVRGGWSVRTVREGGLQITQKYDPVDSRHPTASHPTSPRLASPDLASARSSRSLLAHQPSS